MTDLAKQLIGETVVKQEAVKRLAELDMAAQKKVFGGGNLFKDQNVGEVFAAASKEINDWEAVVVYLASEWPEKYLFRLGEVVRKILEKDVFIEPRIEPELLGGMAIVSKGKYYDFSLREKLATEKEKIAGIYQKFLA